jgi:formate hydrogenlyase subunit 3/multisubunit Na+/H+ antiporter MnhD subunit
MRRELANQLVIAIGILTVVFAAIFALLQSYR